jgi:proteasome accessory factor B
VRIRFRGVAARLVGERVWHPSQSVRTVRSGLELELKTGISPDLRQWILGWGEEAEVMEPADLRREVARMAAAAASIYRRANA